MGDSPTWRPLFRTDLVPLRAGRSAYCAARPVTLVQSGKTEPLAGERMPGDLGPDQHAELRHIERQPADLVDCDLLGLIIQLQPLFGAAQ